MSGADYATRPLHRCVCGQRGRWTFVWRVWQCVPCGRVSS